ncbi:MULTISPECIES: tRNA-dihydrouridine synthase [Rheinheimera]|uniref:tRNA-dihydrouridine(16) synthase n=1 Tax=Rheinheimera marina TaxID=1774958 RepID=A0ABV9JMG5_9GAMM
MRIVLAPMEGVVDHLMRDMLTRIGGFDLCVTEFVRVVDMKLPRRVFYRLCPELGQGGKTPSGVPVKIQLLGQDPNWLAENALKAVELGSPGVDLNFGCPAKMVNKNKGGAVLLKETDTLYQIIKTVRAAVPAAFPVTAKIRLGFDDTSLTLDNARALYEAGATELTVHARTKADGYRPPAYWPWIEKIRAVVPINVIANGEIWTPADAALCQQQSGSADIMLGRGALARPSLAKEIVAARSGTAEQAMPWPEVLELLLQYSDYEIAGDKGLYYSNRIKQWFSYLKLQYPEAELLFSELRLQRKAEEIVQTLQQALRQLE